MTTLAADSGLSGGFSSRSGAGFGRRFLYAYIGLFLVVLYLPMVLLVLLSFNSSDVMAARYEGFTVRWYVEIMASGALTRAIVNSLLLGLLSSAIATFLAVTLALGLRRDIPCKQLIMRIILVPILIPGIVSGVILLMYFGYAGVKPGLWTTVLPTHVTWVLPFAFLTILPRIQALDPNLEEAAADLGATRLVVFWRIIFPLIRRAMLATVLFGFTISFDEFIRSFFVVGRERTIPVFLWELLSEQMAPYLPAVGVVVTVISVFVSVSGFAVTAWANRVSYRNRADPGTK